MRLDNAYPVVQGYKNSAGIGYHFNFADPLNFASLGITAAYTPSTNCRATSAATSTSPAATFPGRPPLSWNRSDFYDLFGPTKRSRKGYAAKLGYDWLLIYDEPRKLDLIFDFAYYDQIDTLPNAQNIETNFTRLVTGRVGLEYTDVKRSIGAVDDEKGIAWKLVYQGNRVNGQVTPQVLGTLDLRHGAAISQLVVVVADRGRRRQRRSTTRRSRISTSADSATTMSTTGRSSAIASITRCPDSGSRRSARSSS